MPDAAQANVRNRGTRIAGPLLLGGFAVSLFGSAFLLFSVQPLVSRLILPRLGGSPGVWNTCVCFFQAMLLVGYCYAHVVSTRLRPQVQVILHGLLLAAALSLLPLSLGNAAPPAEASPVPWLLSTLALRTGLPFVVISATAPLLQAWFARTTHPHAKDPYFLYAASNAGSLVALLGYPLVIETTLDLSEQLRLWSQGLVIIAVSVMVSGAAALWRQRAAAGPKEEPRAAYAVASAAIPGRERLRWVLLSFVPSALMLAVTTHITTDVASVPLFWVVPLAIYILTFIVAFGRRVLAVPRLMLIVQGVSLVLAGMTGLEGTKTVAAMLIPLCAFATTAMVCHTDLAARRPEVRHLTGYFLLISVGGAAGGLFNALLAPVLFPLPLEYPLLLVATCLLRPKPSAGSWADTAGDVLFPMVLILAGLMLLSIEPPGSQGEGAQGAGLLGAGWLERVAIAGLFGVTLLWFTRRRVRLAVALGACLAGPMALEAATSAVTARDFFGVLRVKQLAAAGLTVIQHGTTVHGMQGDRPGEERTPLGYYRHDGSFGRFFAVSRQPTPAVGVLGLGAGGLGCYARPGETWTFYEIDPLVAAVARDDRYFHFMSQCGNHPGVIMGDARLRLTADPTRRYNILIVDVFSSDSIPVHLLTQDAMALYLSHLNPGGVVLFHVTNRYLDLVPVVARIAAELDAPIRHLFVPGGEDPMREPRVEVLAIAPRGGSLDAYAADGWDVPQPGSVLWTDERSDVMGVIRWR